MNTFVDFTLEHFYTMSITVGFAVLYILIKLKVKGIELKRLSSLRRRKFSHAIETDAPVEEASQIKEKGLEGLENRFALINNSFPIILLIIWAALISIPYLGKMPSVYMTVVAAIASVIAGVALRPFLENLFSGIVISFFRSIRIGDTVVIDNHYGIIEEISLTYSILKRWDWYRIVIPNSKLLNKEIENLTLNDRCIWAYIDFFVEPDADVIKVEYAAKNAARRARHFSHAEDPSFWVISMEKEAIKCWLAAWADTPLAAWELRHEMRTNLIQALQKEGIGFHTYCHQQSEPFQDGTKHANKKPLPNPNNAA